MINPTIYWGLTQEHGLLKNRQFGSTVFPVKIEGYISSEHEDAIGFELLLFIQLLQ